jgi:tRNA A37 threonylcarbamoyladenosine dehydratase
MNDKPGVEDMITEFSRLERLIGPDGLSILRNATVAIVGLGGVGAAVFEALVRSGIGRFIILDHDQVALSNLNRQLIATHQTIGQLKVDVAAERGRSINPSIMIEAHAVFFDQSQSELLTSQPVSYIVDAIDSITAKIDLVMLAAQHHIPIISSMGTGNKMDPEQLRIGDLFTTINCPLARHMRRELKKRGVVSLPVVWSPEMPFAAMTFSGDETPAPGHRSIPGSTAFVPPTAGFLMAGKVVRDLISGKGSPPIIRDESPPVLRDESPPIIRD